MLTMEELNAEELHAKMITIEELNVEGLNAEVQKFAGSNCQLRAIRECKASE